MPNTIFCQVKLFKMNILHNEWDTHCSIDPMWIKSWNIGFTFLWQGNNDGHIKMDGHCLQALPNEKRVNKVHTSLNQDVVWHAFIGSDVLKRGKKQVGMGFCSCDNISDVDIYPLYNFCTMGTCQLIKHNFSGTEIGLFLILPLHG